MREHSVLRDSIRLLYEQVTGQSAHNGEDTLRDALESCRNAMNTLDYARGTIGTLLRFVGQEDALDDLAESCDHLSEVMFEQGYLLGYERYLPSIDGEYPHLMTVAGPDYGSAPEALVKKHQAIASCMGALFEIDPQAPELETLGEVAHRLETQITKLNSGH